MKHRSTIYCVVREGSGVTLVLDSFASYEAADNRAVAYTQEFLERHINGFTFSVQASTFYDL